MTAFAELQRCSFAGTEFFVEEMQIRGGLRNHTHEYPHVPGGNNELLGRKLYTISIKARFGSGSEQYPDAAVSERLKTLRESFEQGVIDDLVLPTIGTIQAHAVDWSQMLAAGHGNGETAEFEFIEDSIADNLASTVTTSTTNVTSKYGALLIAVDAAGFDLSFFSELSALIAQLKSYRDQFDLYAELIATKAEQLANHIRELNEAIELDPAEFFAVVEAMQDIGVAADALAHDALSRVSPVQFFETPMQMTVAQIGTLLYGDNSHNAEILNLNAIEDAFAIPANTIIAYYAIPTPFGALAA